MTTDSRCTVVIEFEAIEGREDDALRQLAALIRTVVELEPDCTAITVYQDPQHPTRIMLSEEWSSAAAYTGPHAQTPHIRAFRAGSAELFRGDPRYSFWSRVAHEPR